MIARTCFRRYSSVAKAADRLKTTTEKLTGHSDVLKAQELVRVKKNELGQLRNELSEARQSYEEVQQRLKNLYARKTQVYQEQKRDLAALQAVNNEEERLLHLEQDHHTKLESFKEHERECFDHLCDAIQISHEKERAQSERMKYFSRLGSILGAVFGFLGSNLFLRREIRRHNHEQSEKMILVETALQNLSSSSGNPTVIDNEGMKLHSTELKESLGGLKSDLNSTRRDINALCNEIHDSTRVLRNTEDSGLGMGSARIGTDLALVGVVSYSALLVLLTMYYK